MARIVPKTISGRLAFFRGHIDRWEADPSGIGLVPADVAALRVLLDDAQTKTLAAEVAHNAARSATGDQNIAIEHLADFGATLIAKIRVKAIENGGGGEGIYADAGLPLPTGPTTSAIPPAKPLSYTLTPRSDGAIVLSWATDAARVDFYEIQRRLTFPGGQEGPSELLGASRDGTGGYVDLRLPIGFAQVQYTITPVRDRRGRRISGGAVQLSYTPGRIEPRVATGVRPAIAA